MKRLTLYAADPLAVLEREAPRPRDPSCQRCEMHDGARHPCLSGEGEPGGLLLIGESPGRDEDVLGRPFIGASGKELRRLVAAHWKGPVAIDNAMRCAPGRREVKEKHITACRGFLAATLAEARPTRVITLGAWALRSVTGRTFPLMGSRRAYSYLFGQTDDPIPVFHVMHPAAALRNRFLMNWFRDDMRWAMTCAPPPPAPVLAPVRIVETEADALAAVAELSAAEWAAFDVETTGIMYEKSFRLLCLSACAKGSTSAWAWDGASLADTSARRVLIDWLEDPLASKIGQNGKFDCNAVRLTLGARVRGMVGDTRLWRKLLEPEAEGNLAKMSELVGMGGTKEEAREAMDDIVDRVRKGFAAEKTLAKRAASLLAPNGKKWPKLSAKTAEAARWLADVEFDDPELIGVARLDPSEWERWAYGLLDRFDRPKLLRYNARDAVTTARLGEQQEDELPKVPEIDRVRKLVVDRAAIAVTRIEEWGVAVDKQAIRSFDAHLEAGIDVVLKRLMACSKSHGIEDFNPDSPIQVGDLLFKKLGLKADPKDRTDGGQDSTAKAVLEKLADKHPFPKDLVEYRRLTKLKGTYAEGMFAHVRTDGRIHPSVLLDGARSGRTSCQDPNLQNIPRPETAEGVMARNMFTATPGNVLVSLDYSQLELRIAAALSQDPEMIAIFNEGVDYHQRTAELVSKLAWGIPPEQVVKKHRSAAKTINFAVLYGMGDGALAAKIGCSFTEAQRVKAAIMGKFRVLDAWISDCLAYAQRTGLTWTYWMGERARRRPLWQIADQEDAKRAVAEHGAHNTPVQGTAADYCTSSMASVVEWIESEGLEDDVKLVLPVHDQLLLDVRPNMVRETVAVVRDIMLSWDSWGVPIVVDVDTGPSWGSLEKYKEAA